MITHNAQSGFSYLFIDALTQAYGHSEGKVFSIDILGSTQKIKKTNVVMLTTSSYVFRAFMFIYFDKTEETKAYFSQKNNIKITDLNDAIFVDVLCESANMCCGAFNRNLSPYFPHLGLSTPNIIDARCVNMEVLKPQHHQHFALCFDHEPIFYAGIAICGYESLDFIVAAKEVAHDESCGELELF